VSLEHDVRSMIASSAALIGQPTAVTLKSGAVVQALPGTATREDVALGGGTISGQERTLRFVTADAQGLKAGDPLTWNGQNYAVLYPTFLADGLVLKVFLQERP